MVWVKAWKQNIAFTFTLDGDKLDESQEILTLELRNMVALAYKAVPYYRFADRKKIKKHVLQRNITSGDVSRGATEEQNIGSSVSANESRSRAKNFPEGSTVSVGPERFVFRVIMTCSFYLTHFVRQTPG